MQTGDYPPADSLQTTGRQGPSRTSDGFSAFYFDVDAAIRLQTGDSIASIAAVIDLIDVSIADLLVDGFRRKSGTATKSVLMEMEDRPCHAIHLYAVEHTVETNAAVIWPFGQLSVSFERYRTYMRL